MTTPQLAAFSTVGTLLYLGLAIAGEGSAGAFFSHPPLIAVTLALIALSIAAIFTKGNLSTGVREDRSNRWVIAALGVLGILAGFLPAYTDRLDFCTLDGESVRWL